MSENKAEEEVQTLRLNQLASSPQVATKPQNSSTIIISYQEITLEVKLRG